MAVISRYLNRSICVFVAGATVTLAYGWHMHRVRAADRETMDLGRGVQVYLGEPKADTLAALVSAGYVLHLWCRIQAQQLVWRASRLRSEPPLCSSSKSA